MSESLGGIAPHGHEDLFGPTEDFQAFIKNVRIANGANPPSFPSTESLAESIETADPTRELGTTTLRFIFWKHGAGNEKTVIPLLEDCDVLAEEATTNSKFHKFSAMRHSLFWYEKLEHSRLNHRIEPKGPFKQARIASRRLIGSNGANDKATLNGYFLGKFEGVERLDITAHDTPVLHHLQAQEDKAEELLRNTFATMSAWGDLNEVVINRAVHVASLMRFREEIATKQIEQLVDKYPGRTIGILYGKAHHLLTRMVEHEDVVVQRQFAKQDLPVNNCGPNKIVASMNALEAAARVGNNFPAVELNRITLWELALNYAADSHTYKAINDLDNESVSKLAGEMSAIWDKRLYADTDSRQLAEERKSATRALLDKYSS